MPDLLLVEDNPLHIRLVQSMLAEIWPDEDTLRTAMRLDTAMREIGERVPDCVLLDLILPDADHLESVKAVHGTYPDLPIVVLSAHEDDELALNAVGEGAQDYLTKGLVTPDQLARAIRFAVRRSIVGAAQETSAPDVIAETAAGLSVIDTTGTIRLAEPSLGEWLDLAGDGLVGRKVTDIMTTDDDSWEPVLSRRAGTSIREIEGRVRGSSGSLMEVRVQVTALTNGAVTPAGYLALWYVSEANGSSAEPMVEAALADA